jgi:DNA-binding HxlR family transcriptional regulator
MEPEQPLQHALDAIAADRSDSARALHARNLGTLLRNMARFGNRRDDPVRMVQGYLGDRWSSLVMHLLSGGMLRFTELRRLIRLCSAEQDISQRVLTLKLRVLERDGLVDRHVTDDQPPRVEYRLTALGQGAYEHFAALVHWSEQASSGIRAARRDFDARHPDSAAMLDQASDA